MVKKKKKAIVQHIQLAGCKRQKVKEKAEGRGYFKVIVKNLVSLRSEGVAVGRRAVGNHSKVTGEKALHDFSAAATGVSPWSYGHSRADITQLLSHCWRKSSLSSFLLFKLSHNQPLGNKATRRLTAESRIGKEENTGAKFPPDDWQEVVNPWKMGIGNGRFLPLFARRGDLKRWEWI